MPSSPVRRPVFLWLGLVWLLSWPSWVCPGSVWPSSWVAGSPSLGPFAGSRLSPTELGFGNWNWTKLQGCRGLLGEIVRPNAPAFSGCWLQWLAWAFTHSLDWAGLESDCVHMGNSTIPTRRGNLKSSATFLACHLEGQAVDQHRAVSWARPSRQWNRNHGTIHPFCLPRRCIAASVAALGLLPLPRCASTRSVPAARRAQKATCPYSPAARHRHAPPAHDPSPTPDQTISTPRQTRPEKEKSKRSDSAPGPLSAVTIFTPLLLPRQARMNSLKFERPPSDDALQPRFTLSAPDLPVHMYVCNN